MELVSFGDSTSGRVYNKLKTICLSGWEIEQKRITVVNFRMNKRSGYSTCCGLINVIANTPEISNMIEAWFRYSRNMMRNCEITVKDDS